MNDVLSDLTMFRIDINTENSSVCDIAYKIINFPEVVRGVGRFYIQTSNPPTSTQSDIFFHGS